jgi:uncharacterized protein YbcC (UPF0753/DUF2309 family)
MFEPIPLETMPRENLYNSLKEACSTAAPAWPLHSWIAVNPLWKRTHQNFWEVAATMYCLTGAKMCMDTSYFFKHLQTGKIDKILLGDTLAKLIPSTSFEEFIQQSQSFTWPKRTSLLLSDHWDTHLKESSSAFGVRATIQFYLSQFLGSYFDPLSSAWRIHSKNDSLFTSFLAYLENDLFLKIRLGAQFSRAKCRQVPQEAREALAWGVEQLGIKETEQNLYFQSLMHSFPGWASRLAQQSWNKPPQDISHELSYDFVTIQCILDILCTGIYDKNHSVVRQWRLYLEHFDLEVQKITPSFQLLRVWQEAHEASTFSPLKRDLIQTKFKSLPESPRPDVLAVFCIDVRSEVIRRNLEKEDARIQTKGFAGFFGLPLSHSTSESVVEKSLFPGLISGQLKSSDVSVSTEKLAKVISLRTGKEIQAWMTPSPASSFSYVETFGWQYLSKLFRHSFKRNPKNLDDPSEKIQGPSQVQPELSIDRNSVYLVGISDTEKGRLAENILRAMNLTESFPNVVLLVGHGSACTNNPLQAGLNCGACGGNSGEVNAQALADILNDAQVRSQLEMSGIRIPKETLFFGGIHNTTTESIEIFSSQTTTRDGLPSSIEESLRNFKEAAHRAKQAAQKERAQNFPPSNHLQSFEERSRNWAEVRPEWGLANNCAVVAGPRSRTSHLNLKGRVFLHEYDWRKDEDGTILSLIFSAPVVVAHWINMQYYTSCSDPQYFGGGNKTLHNVLGGHWGILEGNTGDLKVGIPWQSVHNGSDWVHEPIRLKVYLDCPEEKWTVVLKNLESVRNLVNQGWISIESI